MTTQLAGLMYYMREREAIRLRRAEGCEWPWTGDKILQTYRFTNVRRSDDRTTKAFVAHYKRHCKAGGEEELLYNAGVARYFGTEAMLNEVGWLDRHDSRYICRCAVRVKKSGQNLYTSAYMITTAGKTIEKHKWVVRCLGGLWRASGFIIDTMYLTKSWKAGYNEMRKLEGFHGSGFMCKEILQDVMLVWNRSMSDAATWTPMGPGSRRGLNRLLGKPVRVKRPEAECEAEVQTLHQQLKGWWSDTYPKSAPLTAHDVQFCLCEYDKYEKMRLGEGEPKRRYRRQP